MKAAVVYGPNDIRVTEVPDPTPAAGQALVRVHAVGVCGSDLPRVLSTGAHYYPIILGHEFSGEVVAVGDGVDRSLIGTRVSGAPLVPCHKCDNCQRGNFSQCPNYTFIGSREPGAFAELVAIPAENLIPLADNVDWISGALFEPSTVALHGLQVAGFMPGYDVAVLGSGTIGAFAVQWARILGAKSITVIDVNPARLELAGRLGATRLVNANDADYLDTLKKDFPAGFKYVIETAGQPATVQTALKLAGARGVISLIGNSHKDLNFTAAEFEQINRKELSVIGSWMSYSAPFPGPEWTMTASYFADGRLRMDSELLHGVYPLDEAPRAFQEFTKPQGVTGKVIFRPTAD